MNRYPTSSRNNDPFSAVDEFVQRWMGQPEKKAFAGVYHPQIEVQESKTAYEVRAELPGLKKEDIHLNFEDNTLYIRGEKQAEEKNDDGKIFYSERSYGSFARMIPFTEKVDGTKIEALYDNGILRVNLMKMPTDNLNSKRITIR